jgi:hypothetical protein
MDKQTRAEKSREKGEYWNSHIEAWKKSGLSQVDYCRENNLSRHRFTYWKCKGDKESEFLRFVPVLPKPILSPFSIANTAPLKVIIGERYRIEIGDGFSPDTLLRLMGTLGRL